MEGLTQKYNLTKSDGRPVDPDGIYFVLKLNSNHADHRYACQEAALTYAMCIRPTVPELADDLRDVVHSLRYPSKEES